MNQYLPLLINLIYEGFITCIILVLKLWSNTAVPVVVGNAKIGIQFVIVNWVVTALVN